MSILPLLYAVPSAVNPERLELVLQPVDQAPDSRILRQQADEVDRDGVLQGLTCR